MMVTGTVVAGTGPYRLLAADGRILRELAADLGRQVADLIGDEQALQGLDLKRYVTDTVGLPTLKDIAEELVKEIGNRLQFLMDVGLDYLTLDRESGTLSGGEAQRIALAPAEEEAAVVAHPVIVHHELGIGDGDVLADHRPAPVADHRPQQHAHLVLGLLGHDPGRFDYGNHRRHRHRRRLFGGRHRNGDSHLNRHHGIGSGRHDRCRQRHRYDRHRRRRRGDGQHYWYHGRRRERPG